VGTVQRRTPMTNARAMWRELEMACVRRGEVEDVENGEVVEEVLGGVCKAVKAGQVRK
jgi:hypothetical protein